MTTPQDVNIVRLANPAGLESVLHALGFEGPAAQWRLHAPNLLTVRGPAVRVTRVASHPAVDRVIALGRDRLYARWPGEQRAPELSNGASFDGDRPLVIAGPCSIESRSQVTETARFVAKAGAIALRGGVFKPRTSPYDFGGLGARGLDLLVAAGRTAGLPVVTEVLDPGCAHLVASLADVLQIGSRNMHNTSLLFALGAHPSGRPALLKRGFAATVDEFLEAAEYFLLGRLAGGHDEPGLILCERGLRTIAMSTRFTLDVAAVPVLRQRSHLPVIVDPSHAAGDRGLVAALGAAAVAAGADGLLVEVHPDPPRAWCDGAQSLDFHEFEVLMASLPEHRAVV